MIILTLLCMIFVLMFPEISSSGVKTGLNLWLYTVIPALFPFILLSNIFVSCIPGGFKKQKCSSKSGITSKHKNNIKVINPSCFLVAFTGLFCGLPIGAKLCGDMSNNKLISQKSAQYLIGFCNNVSPMFLASYINCSIIMNSKIYYKTFLYIYLTQLFVAASTWQFYFQKSKTKTGNQQNFIDINRNNTEVNTAYDRKNIIKIINNSLSDTITTVLKIGGYIIIFSVICSLISYLIFKINSVYKIKNPQTLDAYISSIFEITSGSYEFTNLNITSFMKQKMLCPLLCFGGFSSIFQTITVTETSSISIKKYFITKCYSFFVCILLTHLI